MANISESKTNFIHGLSDLWTRFFKDHEQIRAMYEGTEILIGQAYLELVSSILNISAREIPVFQKEFFKLITVREDHVTYRPSDSKFLFEVTSYPIKGASFLYNKIFDPTTILEKNIDFSVDSSGEEDYLVFNDDPFDWDGAGNPIPGMASRVVRVVDDDGTIHTERELAIWIPDTQIDQYDMYLTYGYLIKRFEPSSEAYRALIQGVIQYFVLGPTVQHLTSALNVIIGLPVIREDGEILQSVDTSDVRYQVVVTNERRYQFDVLIPLRDDVLDESNWGTLEFISFEHLSKVFSVYDYIQDPTWWFDTTVPPTILPDESKSRRVVDPDLYENQVNNPPGLVKIGDPGFFVGADDDGFVPVSGRPSFRHLFSYVVFERFLRHHTFAVVFDSQVLLSDILPFPRLDLDVRQIILVGKSAYTLLYLEPGLVFSDRIYIAQDDSTDVDIKASVLYTEQMSAIDGSLKVGEKSWKIGDYYYYSVGGITVKNELTDPIVTRFENGKTPISLGGIDPTHRVRELATGVGDWGGVVPTNTLDVGADVFDFGDVGRWVRKGSTGNEYHEIIGIQSAQVVLLDAALAADNDDWTLYACENGHERLSAIDWGVQIQVY